jgi:multidrug efflux pump subunit AcrA (membrane-fusion protein)
MRTLSVLLAVVVATAAGTALWQLQGSTSTHAALRTVTAVRGSVIVTVGGLGRIVTAGPKQLAVPAPAPAGGATAPSGQVAAAPAGAVFPAASGHVVRMLVVPGEVVRPGQAVALLDDGGTAAAALVQARDDLAAARVELARKRVTDPTKGLPPTPAELRAAALALRTARARLAVVSGHPQPADLSAARYDVQKAKSDYLTLTQRPNGAAVTAAQLALGVAIQRLALAGGPANQIDVGAAQLDLAKAKAELDALTGAPSQAAVAAAQAAVDLARQRLADLPKGAPRSDLLAAQLELRKAEADLAALTRGGAPSAVAAAQAAFDLATQKLAQLTGPPTRVVVDAARHELQKARADLVALRKPPTAAARAAGRLAIDLAQRKLDALLHATPSVRDAARADVAKALADLDVLRHRGGPAAPADLELARLKVDAAVSHERLAAAQAERLTVRAAAGGTVTSVLAAPGAPADATTPIATVVDLRHLEVSVDLSEFDAARVRRGQRASVAVDALGGKLLPGTVLFEALAGVDNGGVVTFPVRVGLSRLDGVKPGMNASVRIVVAARRNVVKVPLEAVSGSSATVLEPSKQTVRRHVVLGLASNKDVEIKSGLRAGETVVIAGPGGGGV